MNAQPVGHKPKTSPVVGSKQHIVDIIKPLRTAKWQADYSWCRIEDSLQELGADYGGLELCPDFQRGHVWTPAQQTHFIENCLRGVVGSGGYLIQFNCATFSDDSALAGSDLPPGLQCIDGLQRYTAIAKFVGGEVLPFGLSADDLKGTQFATKCLHVKVAIHDFTMRSDLLSYYLALNSGGTQHSAEEIARVRGLLERSSRR